MQAQFMTAFPTEVVDKTFTAILCNVLVGRLLKAKGSAFHSRK